MDDKEFRNNQDIDDNTLEEKSSRRKDSGYAFSPFVYEQGFINGVLSITEVHFPEYINGSQQAKLVSVRLNKVRGAIHEDIRSIQENREARAGLERKVIEAEYRVVDIQREIKEAEELKVTNKQKLNQLQKERAEINPYYNLVLAIIFVLVGIAFIGAEVLITHDVLFNVLAIEHWKSIPLAIAIALISIGIKPAVDRLFEEPYLSGKKRNMKILLGVVSIVALIALGFLGYYRIFGESLFYELDLPNVDATAKQIEIRQQWAIVIFFSLTSILFAITGAISFSIGMPVFNFVLKKRKLRKAMEKMEVKITQLEATIKGLYEAFVQYNTERDTSMKLLERLPDEIILEERLAELRQKEIQELEEYYKNKDKADQAWYQEGLSRGSKYQLTGKLLANPVDLPHPYEEKHGASPSNGKVVVMQPQPKGKYLHEQLRNLISYNFNRNQKSIGE